MYPCPKCGKLDGGSKDKVVKCSCGIYRSLVQQMPPYWIEVNQQSIDENRNKLYNNTKLER